MGIPIKNAVDKAICLLSLFSLVYAEISLTNELSTSMTPVQSSASIPTAVPQNISNYQTNSTTSTDSVSVIPSTHSISATSVMPSVFSTLTTTTSILKSSTNTKETGTPPMVSDGTNVTCSGTGNVTDCKEYTGLDDQSLSTPEIIGIASGAAAFVLIIAVIIGVCCAKKKQRLSGSKADLSTYWEDNVTLSYINGHIDLPRDYPDEMISLDNDSFLNSLDSMSFSNMWTAENTKRTNF